MCPNFRLAKAVLSQHPEAKSSICEQIASNNFSVCLQVHVIVILTFIQIPSTFPSKLVAIDASCGYGS